MPPFHKITHLATLTALALCSLPASAQPEAPAEKPAQKKAAKPKAQDAEQLAAVTIKVIPNLVKFDTLQFDVHAGAKVRVLFENGCVMPHNLLFLPKDAEPAVVAAVNALGADGFEKGFVPAIPEIIAATKLLPSGGSETLRFVAPQQPGEYLFLCTFPGHWFTMRGVMRVRPPGEKLAPTKKEASVEIVVPDALKNSGISHKPVGSKEKPFVMRTFLPDPGLDDAVFAHHDSGKPALKYDPASREDVFTEEKDPVTGQKVRKPSIVMPEAGIAGAIAVNYGTDFSYAWDTTECRLMYAWRGGFLDMDNYWGKEPGTSRPKFYIPNPIGRIVYRTSGKAPLADEKNEAPQFGGYRMVGNVVEFYYRIGERQIRERIVPKGDDFFELEAAVSGNAPLKWNVSEKDTDAVKTEIQDRQVKVRIQDRAEEPFAPVKKRSSAATEKE